MSSHDFFAQSFINWWSTVNIRGLWLGPPLWPNMCGCGNRVAQIPMIHHIHHHLPNQHDIHFIWPIAVAHPPDNPCRPGEFRSLLVNSAFFWTSHLILTTIFSDISHILLLKSPNLVDFSILIFVRWPLILLVKSPMVGQLLRRDHRGLLRPCGACREVVALVWISCWCQLEDTVGLDTSSWKRTLLDKC